MKFKALIFCSAFRLILLLSFLCLAPLSFGADHGKFVFMGKQLQSGAEDLLVDYWALFLTMKTTPSGTGKYLALEIRLSEIEDSLKEKGFNESDLSDLSRQASEHYDQRVTAIKAATADAGFQYLVDKILKEKMKLEDLSGLLLEYSRAHTSSEIVTSSFVGAVAFHAQKMPPTQKDHFSNFAAKIWLFTELQRREKLELSAKQRIMQAAAKDFVNFVAVSVSEYTSLHKGSGWNQTQNKTSFHHSLLPAISEVFVASQFDFDSEALDLFKKEKEAADKGFKSSGFVFDGIKALQTSLKHPDPVRWFRAVGITGVGFMLSFGFFMNNIFEGTTPSHFTVGFVGVLWWKILQIVNSELNLIPNFKWYFNNSRQLAAQNRFTKIQINKLLSVVSDPKQCRLAVSKVKTHDWKAYLVD